MATEAHEVSGEVRWAQVYKPNKFGKFSLQFYPDEATRKAIKNLGTRLGVKEDEHGWNYTFRKDPENKIDPGPPVVTDAEDKPFTKLIGNGSTCKIFFDVYDFDHPEYGAGKGTRLKKVQVLKHVEYNPQPVQAELPVEPETVAVPTEGKKPKRAF